MTTSTPLPQRSSRRDRNGSAQRTRRSARRQARPALVVSPPAPNLDALATRWQRALDAGDRALRAAAGSLPAAELGRRRRSLGAERQLTAELLLEAARASRVRAAPWLAPGAVTPAMLGLPAATRACVFELEGVLTDSGLLHARAWGEALDDVLLRLAGETGWHFIPFDRDVDYRAFFDGRSRLDGVHAFLDSRGLALPAGRPDDPAHAATVHGVAKRKGEALARGLRRRGVAALPGARRYLQAAGHAGLARAVVSASASTAAMLELAGLRSLVEARVDADVIADGRLHTPPAPDLLRAACGRLQLDAADVVAFTHTPAGIAAARAAGATVVAVGAGRDEEILRGFGAEHVVPSLADLLDPRLAG